MLGEASGMEMSAFVDVLRNSFSAYYNIFEPDADSSEVPLAFRADYYSRAEKYWLSKKITVWSNETNEFAYIFSVSTLNNEIADKCLAYALKQGLPRVKPHKEHQYTNIKIIFLSEHVDEKVAEHVRKMKYSKNYHFSLHGFTELKAAAVDLSLEKIYVNRAGHELTSYFSKLFAANHKTASSNKKLFSKE